MSLIHTSTPAPRTTYTPPVGHRRPTTAFYVCGYGGYYGYYTTRAFATEGDAHLWAASDPAARHYGYRVVAGWV